ncbi:daunorubicin/doxorubicin resistance ABC transporter ATP-binding protein DrrA [Curtobacterium sp. MCJR17_055]|uniref:ATP-binding cassette domain-containing protein n=1 Tax=unclassified Curtobacterium TaxID=257496 RepID=UPI000D8983B8|nr:MULTISPECIES: ATP-binding cassette domain-containing protein [unclassified Curtobacterium]PYY36986.1 daunorubicin/doxorubicin resistance ABC transporter ATP-binding protein DrrA [Curtobacterium sp. MCBD17_029]PYY55219.1 daunorubicin/doxorubicin resistance ABC transporter ATP-binding protein DrrA [Curtobacterium sp. MCPF17_015]PYY58356.1 daunorubicin/doxorubicin resistance ABC transporter ATP-binding protein DrrA [Curtobacterium sp. MCJR17_055]
MAIIEATDLTKTYTSRSGPVHALAGLDLSVPEGTVTALLGPNGAGKTTTVKVLTTLVVPDAGTATVAGTDVVADPQGTRRAIGVSGQYAAVDENLTGAENLEMIGRLYHLGRRAARDRARELIDVFGLAEAGDRPVKGFSGGMRRRIDLAGALVMNPRVLFLDEPTTGLDPRSRLALWGIIEDLVADGATVLLTTQYLEEADQLADDIAVIDDGRVIAEGTSDELKAQVGGHRLAVTLVDAADGEPATAVLRRHGSGEVETSADGRSLAVAVDAGPAALQRVLADLGAADVALHDAGMRRPTLDDVFLRLTGHAATADEAEAGDGSGAGRASRRGRGAPPTDGGATGTGAGSPGDPDAGSHLAAGAGRERSR